MDESVHIAVMKEEVIHGLNLKNGDIVIDATLGGGGHSIEILKNILPNGTLIVIDQDKEAIERFKKKIESLNFELKVESLILINDNFSNIGKIIDSLKINSVNAILADLGLSSDQIESKKRGFSFQDDSLLDMRMDQSSKLTARKVVNEYTEDELTNIFKEFGEEKFSRRIASNIVSERKTKPIETTVGLVEVIKKSVPAFYTRKKIHFATKTFQALRMEVNREVENLKEFLPQAVEVLKTNGRLAVISFHSGEDRLVKKFFRSNAGGCICLPEQPICICGEKAKVKIITKKPLIASKSEIEKNPRSRSAKLRIAEKI